MKLHSSMRWYAHLLILIEVLLIGSCSKWDAEAVKAVVEEYCALDYDGARIGTHPELNKRYSSLIAWEAEPGWDTVLIISSYRVSEPMRKGRYAFVEVVYSVVGRSDEEEVTKRSAFQEKVEYRLIRDSDRWKIDRGLVPPHVSLAEMIFILEKLVANENDSNRKQELQLKIEQYRSLAE